MSTMIKQQISSEIRNLIINGYIDGYNYAHLSDTFKVNVNSVKSVVRNFKKYGRFPRARGHRPNKLNSDQRAKLIEWVDEDCQRTLEDLANKVKEEFGINISPSTVHSYLNKLHFSFKRIHPIPDRRNCASTIEQRFEYALKFLQIDGHRDKVFFIDETGISIHCRYNYGRSKKGEKANLKVRAIKGKSYSVCAAMSFNGLYFYQAQDTSYNTFEFIDFLRQFLAHLSADKITGAYLIMDNVRFHHADTVRELISESNHNIVFLPPYSPFLNPIEEMFNQLKFYVKRMRPENPDDLFHAIELASDVITQEDCAQYYRHMLEYITKCSQRNIIMN